MTGKRFGRRPLLVGAAGVVGAGIVGCSNQGNKTTAAENATNAKVKLPTYTPYSGVKADFPAVGDKVLAAYVRYPASPVKAYDGVPGKGGTVTAMNNIYTPVPPGLNSNPYWQALNKKLGVDLKINMIPVDNWGSKFQTTIAGGDLPDIMQIASAPELPQLLKAKFTDISEYVSGDAVKKYKFLANIPSLSWSTTVYNGGIYGVPIPRGVLNSPVFERLDFIEAKGLNPTPKNFADFKELCQGLVDKKKNRYASGDPGNFTTFVRQMLGSPTTWTVKDGKFTNQYETPEFKQALSSVRELVQAGIFHPDSFTSSTVQRKSWFTGGIIALDYDAGSAWTAFATDPGAVKQGIKVGAIIPPGYYGGKGRISLGSGSYATVAFKKATKSRIEELLEIANYLATPYGTQEYLFRKFGIEGTDYTMQGGNPVLTDEGTRDTTLTTAYITDAPQVLGPGTHELIKPQYEYELAVAPLTMRDPSVGLYSDTNSRLGANLSTQVSNFANDYLQGRKPLSGWDEVVKKWRSSGGDKIRQEFEQAYQAVH